MKSRFAILILFSIIVFSCLKKDDLSFKNLAVTGWQPDWAVPLTNTTLTLKNLVQHAYSGNILTTDSTGLYSIHYDGRLLSAYASDYVKIPDQNFNTSSIPLSTGFTGTFTGTITDTFSDHFSYTDTTGAQLNHLNLKSGSLQIQIQSTYQQNISATVLLPTIKKNGVPLSITFAMNYPTTTANQNLDLSNYKIDFTNGNTTNNYLPYKISYSLTSTGNPISSTDNIVANVNLTNLQFSFVDGFLGHHSIPINRDTIAIEIFNNTLNANIFLENPIIKLIVDNSFGVSAVGTFNTFEGITKQGIINNIGGNFFNNPIALNGPTTIGTTVVNHYQIDKTNSNVQNVFNPAPNRVVFQGNISINGSGTPTYNFITDTSKIIVNAEAVLPAWFRIIDFSLQDTFALGFPRDTNILNRVQFKLLCENAFGLYAAVQLYFTDSTYHILDSLIVPLNGAQQTNIIAQAPVNANGVVNGSTTAQTIFDMDRTRYKRIASRVRHGLVRGNLKSSSSSSGISIQIHSKDYLRVQLAAHLWLNIKKANN